MLYSVCLFSHKFFTIVKKISSFLVSTVKGRKKYRIISVRSLFAYDYLGISLGYGMIRILGSSKDFSKKRRFILPASSTFEYHSLGDRLNKKLFIRFLNKRFSFRNKYVSFLRLRGSRPQKKVRKSSRFILYLRMLTSYFKDIGLRALFRFMACARRKNGGYLDNLLILFECRLVSIMYRLYFFYNLTDSLKFLTVNPI